MKSFYWVLPLRAQKPKKRMWSDTEPLKALLSRSTHISYLWLLLARGNFRHLHRLTFPFGGEGSGLWHATWCEYFRHFTTDLKRASHQVRLEFWYIHRNIELACKRTATGHECNINTSSIVSWKSSLERAPNHTDSAHEKQEVLPRKHQQWVEGFAGLEMYATILKKKSCDQWPLSLCPLSTSCLQKQSCTIYMLRAHTHTLNSPWRGGNGAPRRNSSFQRKPPPPRAQTDRGWWTSWSSHDRLFTHQQGAPTCKTEEERKGRKVRWNKSKKI